MIWPKRTKFAASNGVGPMIVMHILYKPVHLSIHQNCDGMPYCIRKGSCRIGFRLDHTRPLQPKISMIPESTAVGKSHQIRNMVASTACAPVRESRDRTSENDDSLARDRDSSLHVEIMKSTRMRMHIHSVGT